MKRACLASALLLLAACGSDDDASQAGGVTAGEASALDDAAAMVEAKRLPPEAIPAVTAPQAQPSAPSAKP